MVRWVLDEDALDGVDTEPLLRTLIEAIADDARDLAPEDTRRLKENIRVDEVDDRHAILVADPVRMQGESQEDAEAYAWWVEKGTNDTPAQPFMAPATYKYPDALMPLLPTSRLVVIGWLKLVVPDVGADTKLPRVDEALWTKGFVRVPVVGGGSDPYVPMREPVVRAECWVAPPSSASGISPESTWARADQLGERLLQATYDPEFMGQLIDLSEVGNYAPARVHTVQAVSDPERVDNKDNWARVDIDLEVLWSTA